MVLKYAAPTTKISPITRQRQPLLRPLKRSKKSSAGIINLTPERNKSIEEFIRKADTALYQEKASGRNQWVTQQT